MRIVLLILLTSAPGMIRTSLCTRGRRCFHFSLNSLLPIMVLYLLLPILLMIFCCDQYHNQRMMVEAFIPSGQNRMFFVDKRHNYVNIINIINEHTRTVQQVKGTILQLRIESTDPSSKKQNQNQHQQPNLDHRKEQSVDLNDIDIARLRYESTIGPLLFHGSDNDNQNNNQKLDNTSNGQTSSSSSSFVVLTNAGRRRRQLEIQLLQSLLYSDDAIDELMSLWLSVECCCDSVGKQLLIDMETTVSIDDTNNNSEQLLRQIIQQSNYQWTEPMNRLALFLFYQGKYIESQHYCNLVLQIKPWHYEAIQLQVLLSLVLGQRYKSIYWARQGLPPLQQQPKRRSRWVKNAVHLATTILQQLEDSDYTNRHDHLTITTNTNTTTNTNHNDDCNKHLSTLSSVWE